MATTHGITLRVIEGVHAGAQVFAHEGDILVIGCAPDCDVILSDAGVAAHHCILALIGERLSVREVDAPVLLDGQRYAQADVVHAERGARLQLGSAQIEVSPHGADADAAGAMLSSTAELVATAHTGGWRTAARSMRWALTPLLILVACAAWLPMSGRLHAQPARQAAVSTPEAPATAKPATSIAHDVAEVLRLSGIACEASDDGAGVVTVRGHLGDGRALAEIIDSRAIREIDGLKRVVAINLDQARPTVTSASENDRIVSVIAGNDPYVVTADGSHYYVGAQLPQGGRLTGVEDGAAVIERDGRIEHWKALGERLGG